MDAISHFRRGSTGCPIGLSAAGFLAAGLLVAGLVLSLAGCAVGPDFVASEAPDVTGYTPEPLAPRTAAANVNGGEPQRFVRDLDIPGDWWLLFRSKPLDNLIQAALKNNHDLKAAEAALQVAQENVEAQRGFFYPTVAGSMGGTRQKTATGTLSSNLSNGGAYYSLFTPQVSVSYTPDVFGLNRRTVESLQAQAEVQRFQLDATYLTLTSNLVAAAVQEAALRGQIAATRKIIEIEMKLTDTLRRERGLGQVAEIDVAAQEAALAQAQTALPTLEKQLSLQRNLLIALTGRLPSEGVGETFDLDSLHLPEKLPVSLPSKLVRQRPDIRAAEENLHSASALVGVAIANRLPNVTLTADAGSTALQLSKLFTPGAGFWTVGAALAQPVFDGGTLLHRQGAAEAALVQAQEQYKSAVVNAFQNVSDSLRALQHDADSVKVNFAAERAAEKSLSIATGQLKLGLISNLAVLNAQQSYQQSLVNLVQARANRFADTAALFQALGGGWWNRPDDPSNPIEPAAKAKIAATE